MAVAVDSDPVVIATNGLVGTIVDAITVLLAGVTIVLVLRVVAVVPGTDAGVGPVVPGLDSITVFKGEVTLVFMISEPPVVFTIVFLVFPSLFILFSVLPPVIPPYLLILPMGCGTFGSSGGPEVGGPVVGGCWSGFHCEISQSLHDLVTLPDSLQ